jgi:sporulation protein YlmC with PRC-barrel domain
VNSKHLKGLAVISIADGEKMGTIDRVLIDPASAKVSGFSVGHGGGLLAMPADPGTEQLIDVDDIHALGQDAVTLRDKGAARGDQTTANEASLLDLDALTKLKVITEGGTYVGDLASVEIDERSFKLSELEVSPGFFKSNRHVPIDQVVNIGHELIVVNDSVCVDESATPEPGEQRLVVGDA